MEARLEDLEVVPEKEIEEWTAAKAAYEEQRTQVETAKEGLTSAQQAITRDVQTHLARMGQRSTPVVLQDVFRDIDAVQAQTETYASPA